MLSVWWGSFLVVCCLLVLLEVTWHGYSTSGEEGDVGRVRGW